ncbi:MAG: PTS sugar transporter subunit IIC, partial [Candidatus Nanohaloarchaea archaeon]
MKIIAVTSCPTGIAHSEMAAESMETEAEERGHDIKVEIR